MGLATTAVLQQQLHHRTSVCLATKSFQSQPSVVLLNHLIENLFMRETVLKIGPRLMQQLLDGFLYHDLSLSSFMQRIHLIIMQHYIVVPVSTLSCSTTEVKVCKFKFKEILHYLHVLLLVKSKTIECRQLRPLPPIAIIHETCRE